MKRILCIVMACLLAFGAAACASPAAEEEQATVESAAETAAEPASEPAQEPSTTDDPNAVIEFNDDVLESMIREAMGKPEGDILVSDALTVTELDLSMEGSDWSNPRIQNIDALKYFTNLTCLAMNWALQNSGKGVDLSPLSGLVKLESLQLCCDDVNDISPLANLVNLTDLWIWGCGAITDISALSGMTNMGYLWIKGNCISDISPLSGMTNLRELCMEENLVSDITPLAELTNLTSLLLSGNLILDYSPLSDIYPNLTESDFEPVAEPQPIDFQDAVLEQKIREALDIPEGDITFAQTKDVTELALGNEWQETVPDDIKITNISALKYFPNLYKLELMFNGVSGIDVLHALPNLGILDLNGNPIYNITPVASCKNLTYLNLSGCYEEDLSALSDLSMLEWLSLSYSPSIGSIEPLAGLTSLKSLYLENVMVDFSPLAGLTNLTTLYIWQDTDQDLSVLAAIYPNLTDRNFEIPEG